MSLAQHYRRLARAAAWYGDHASARIYTRQALRYNAAPFKEDDHPRDEKGRFAHKEARAALQSWHAENVSQGYQGARAEARQKTVDTVAQLGKASRTLGVNDAAAVREHLEQAGKGWESLRSHAHDWVSAVEGYLQEHLSDVATDAFLADNRDTIKEAFAEADKEAGEKIKAIHAAIQSKKRIKERIGDVKGQIGDLRTQQAKLRKDAAKMEADSTKQLDKADDRIEAGSDLVDEMLEWAEDQLVQGVTGYEDWVEKEPPHTWNTPSKLGDYPATTGKDAAQYVAGSLSGLSQRLEKYLADLGPKYGPLADKILKQWDKKIGKWQDSNLDPIAGHVDAHVKLYADAQAAMREAGEIDGKLGELHSKAEDLGYEYNNANDDHHAAVDELVDVEEELRNTLHEALTGMVEEVDAELEEEPEEEEEMSKFPIHHESAKKYAETGQATAFRIHDADHELPEKSRNSWIEDKDEFMPGVSGFANMENAIDDMIFGETESTTGENYTSQVENPSIVVLSGRHIDGPGAEVVVPDAKIAAVFDQDQVRKAFMGVIQDELETEDKGKPFDEIMENYRWTNREKGVILEKVASKLQEYVKQRMS